MKQKRKTIYKGSRKNWALMMNALYNNPNMKFKETDKTVHGEE